MVLKWIEHFGQLDSDITNAEALRTLQKRFVCIHCLSPLAIIQYASFNPLYIANYE